jgi:hypothetical protein
MTWQEAIVAVVAIAAPAVVVIYAMRDDRS